MNIGYIIDLNGIIKEEAMHIPHLRDLHYKTIVPNNLKAANVRGFRDEVILRQNYANQEIDKHLFFFVITNDKETLEALSKCLNDIQADKVHFNQAQYEMHVVCNIVKQDGFSIGEYEKMMPCLKNNTVCVYSWLLDNYDYSGDKPIVDTRRAHAIARLVWMVCNHRGDLSLQQMNLDYSPIYNLFGDSCIFFNEKERDEAVSNYYYFKNLQHLLNIPDGKLNDYIKEHILPYKDKQSELDKRIDTSSGAFLKEQRMPIEASVITEKTQGLLIKSSDDDTEYLVNASDNKLVFIDNLSHNQRWQLDGTEEFLSTNRSRANSNELNQETVSDDFINDLHDKLVIHNRSRFDEINNEVSKSRRKQIMEFKQNVDKHLNKFLNKHEKENYGELLETITPQDAKRHNSNIDYGIAFMEYLESGNGDYLIDQKVSAGDISFKTIKDNLEVEESRRLTEYEDANKKIAEKYQTKKEGHPSIIKTQFDACDKDIKKYREEIRLCNYQFEHWFDEDNKKKLTVRSKATIYIAAGIALANLWRWISAKYLYDYMVNELGLTYYKEIHWILFSVLAVAGIAIGLYKVFLVWRRRKNAEEALKKTIQRKERLMHDCVEEMKDLVEKHYKYILAYHGLKTIKELMDFVSWKKEDLIIFRKILFKQMLKYAILIAEQKNEMPNDYNTIELHDTDVKRLLFGTDENKKTVPYCFARGGVTLAETFENFKQKKVMFETTRFNIDHPYDEEYDPSALEQEVIDARKIDLDQGIVYGTLNTESVLPTTDCIVMDDIHQGFCGDCYFLATLASIANKNPEFIIGKNGIVEELGDDHKFFRVKFYGKDGKRFNVDVDNKFWNRNGTPYYAGFGKNNSEDNSKYNPWVMAVEKAWAKANNDGYDGIEGASADGLERVRKMEYSYAVTGKSAFYCITKNVSDINKLLTMMKKHFNDDKLPITLYSASEDDSFFGNRDVNIVSNHAYALRSINDDDTFEIFNPWNSHSLDEDVIGKHYGSVNINFIKDNFDIVVFFGIKESDFASFERDLTNNASEKEVYCEIENTLNEKFKQLSLDTHNMKDLMTDNFIENAFVNSTYLFSRNRMKDERGINKDEQHLIYIEGGKSCSAADEKMLEYINGRGLLKVMTMVYRDDDKQTITLFRLSPQYVLSNFHDLN